MTAPTPAYDIGIPYHAVARHTHFHSTNAIHVAGLAERLGFRGAFVLGIANFGLMTRALVARFGEAWLGHAVLEVKFLKPVCEGDRIRVETRSIAGREAERACEVIAVNETAGGEVSARLETSMPASLPPVDACAAAVPNEWEGPVTQVRTWDSVIEGRAYRTLRHVLSADDNAAWLRILGDDLPIYAAGDRPPVHPAHVLRQVQLGTNHECITEHAVHCSTRAVFRRVLRVGDPAEVLTVPLAKWEKKGNQWITVYCAVRVGTDVCAELFHTQIIRLRGAEAPAAATGGR